MSFKVVCISGFFLVCLLFWFTYTSKEPLMGKITLITAYLWAMFYILAFGYRVQMQRRKKDNGSTD